MDKLEVTKKVIATISGVGASVITAAYTSPVTKAVQNPLIKVAVYVGSVGIGAGVAKFAEKSMSEYIDDLAGAFSGKTKLIY